MKTVFNPDEETLDFGYSGHSYKLAPGESVWEDGLADQTVATLGQWGVCILSDDSSLNDKAKELAVAVWKDKTRQWSLEEAKAYAAHKKLFEGTGVEVVPTPDQKYALEWLAKHGA